MTTAEREEALPYTVAKNAECFIFLIEIQSHGKKYFDVFNIFQAFPEVFPCMLIMKYAYIFNTGKEP